MPPIPKKDQAPQLSPRKIRRTCSKELYRALKRMKKHVPDEQLKQGEELYYRKVIGNLIWINENHSNRRVLCDWWDENVSSELAELWEVDQKKLCSAFREAFGG